MDKAFNCRLCGKIENHTPHHLPCLKYKYLRDINLALHIDVQKDPDHYPEFICDSCRLKLTKWRKNKNKNKKASINISVVDFDTPNLQNESYNRDNLHNVEKLAKELDWVICNKDTDTSQHFIKLKEEQVQISIILDSDCRCSVKILGKHVAYKNILGENPSTDDPTFAATLLRKCSEIKLCPGNNDFSDVCRGYFPETMARFENVGNETIAVEEQCPPNETTVRTISCSMFCSQDEERCTSCKLFRTNLHMRRGRMNSLSTATKPQHRLDYMTPSQLKERVLNAKEEVRGLKRKIDSLKGRLVEYCDVSGVSLDEGISKSFLQIMQENSHHALSKFEEDSPQHILWKQQFEAATKSDLRQMRWHPTLLRWCIALHAKSPAAYRMIKKSKVLRLPHENTLRDYSKFTTSGSGWNPEVITRAIQDHAIYDNPLKRNVSLLFDEVKVKSGLVYCSETGKLIGFCDLGSINNDIKNFYISDSKADPDLATHILAIMIRGIFSNLECVVAHYPCKGFNSHQLFWVIWEGIGILELAGFIIRALVCDGATPNRKFYRIHGQNQDLCYFTNNEFGNKRKLYFICDAPHLMKTTRNNFENSGWNNKTRNLMFNGKPIKWSQIVSLVEEDINGMGLRLLPRMTYEHLHLTPTLRMKVKLAVQILSSSVANALRLKGNAETQSTQMFIRMFDQFFDCLNVSNMLTGVLQRKEYCAPYTDMNDWRFKWLEQDFLGFLTQWEREGENQAGLSQKERKQLCLSRETLEGLRITVKSFVALGKELLLLPGVKFLLSEKFNQDPLEEYFSKQRGMGGFCDNPTVRQFQHNALKLQVANAPAVLSSARGNCQPGQNHQQLSAPMSRRKHTRH